MKDQTWRNCVDAVPYTESEKQSAANNGADRIAWALCALVDLITNINREEE